MNPVWLAGGIFLITYALIVTERVHRTVSALLGGVAMILLGVLSQEEAFHAIDWNVIFLLAGMMVIANVLRETGLFQWIAIQTVKLGQGDPFRILVILSAVIAVSSALLDNVTIVVLAAPVALFVAASLRVSPMPFLIAAILASNIGGTATLVGDPPNILIGSAAGIDFLTFAANLAPISLLILIVFLGLSWFLFRNDLRSGQSGALDIDALETEALITDRSLLRKALVVMAGVIVGFLMHGTPCIWNRRPSLWPALRSCSCGDGAIRITSCGRSSGRPSSSLSACSSPWKRWYRWGSSRQWPRQRCA